MLNGRIMTILGFTLSMICSLLNSLIQPSVINGIISNNVLLLLQWTNCISLLIATVGFGLKWIQNHDPLNLITTLTVGFVAVLPIIQLSILQLFGITPVIQAILHILSCLHYFVFSLRALRFNRVTYNKLIAFICGCAGIYSLLGSSILYYLTTNMFGAYDPVVIYTILLLVCEVVCRGVRVLECVQEAN